MDKRFVQKEAEGSSTQVPRGDTIKEKTKKKDEEQKKKGQGQQWKGLADQSNGNEDDERDEEDKEEEEITRPQTKSLDEWLPVDNAHRTILSSPKTSPVGRSVGVSMNRNLRDFCKAHVHHMSEAGRTFFFPPARV